MTKQHTGGIFEPSKVRDKVVGERVVHLTNPLPKGFTEAIAKHMGQAKEINTTMDIRINPVLRNVSTKDLVEELSNRAGVCRYDIAPQEQYTVDTPEVKVVDSGPAIVLTIED